MPHRTAQSWPECCPNQQEFSVTEETHHAKQSHLMESELDLRPSENLKVVQTK